MRDDLLGYLLEALDADERDRLEGRLKSDARLSFELEQLHEGLEPLRADDEVIVPPSGLAERTCQLVSRTTVQKAVRRPERDAAAALDAGARETAARETAGLGETAGPASGWSLADYAVAASVFLAAGLLMIPAIHHSRFSQRLAHCQNNLRQLGVALASFSQANGDYFPAIEPNGSLSNAGVYAARLYDGEYLRDPDLVLCPSSPQADRAGAFRIPRLNEIQAASEDVRAHMQRTMGGSYAYNLGYVNDRQEYRPLKYRGRKSYALMADAPSMELEGRRSAHHGGCGHNVLMEDGSVRYLTTCKASDADDNIYLNENGLMAAGTHVNDAVVGPSAATPLPRLISLDRQ